MENTPRRMPAEWSPQSAVWFAWPHAEHNWPDHRDAVLHSFLEIFREVTEVQTLKLLLPKELEKRHILEVLRRSSINVHHVECHQVDTNDAWLRDSGLIFVKENDKVGGVAWRFNGWGEKYAHDHDAQVALKIADFEKITPARPGVVLEGGSIDVNGAGDPLTTEQCLLNQNRNATLSKCEMEDHLKRELGIKRVHWLGDGLIGDHTDGHIDNVARFVDENTIASVYCSDRSRPDHAICEANWDRLRSFLNAVGKPFRLVGLPFPSEREFSGHRLVQSYANFLVINQKVLVPTFADSRDEQALTILSKLFPTRKMVPIDCRVIAIEGGTIHCLSQQQPA